MERIPDTDVLFEVHGRGDFPVDMLRHDQCWPADTHSALAILHRDLIGARESDRRVYLRMITRWGTLGGPTVARWASFGWGVRLLRADCGAQDLLQGMARELGVEVAP